MNHHVPTLQEHFEPQRTPKRILALDGGGLRGMFTLGVLLHLEKLLRARHGGRPDFRLCHYFDLVAGTSTGAIIAAALALGWPVRRIIDEYIRLGERVFERSWLRWGLFRASYAERQLTAELKRLFGMGTTLGSEDLLTGLLVIMKRLDTGSPWPVGNNPRGKYFRPDNDRTAPNADYPLWQVVRASTAAPTYFQPERIRISTVGGLRPREGLFVDGGVTPFNNPSLQALAHVTLKGFQVGWSTGEDELLMVSVGTGRRDPAVERSSIAALHGVRSLQALMEDCGYLQELMMQWLSSSPTARSLDSEVGNLTGDQLAGRPLLHYLRYDLSLEREVVKPIAPDATYTQLRTLAAMDRPANMRLLHTLGRHVGEHHVLDSHFPTHFDLAPS